MKNKNEVKFSETEQACSDEIFYEIQKRNINKEQDEFIQQLLECIENIDSYNADIETEQGTLNFLLGNYEQKYSFNEEEERIFKKAQRYLDGDY